MSEKPRKPKDNHLATHKVTVFVLYVLGSLIAAKVMSMPEAQRDLVTLLSTGAILATFGSALSALGSLRTTDLLERVKLNVDILLRDLLKQDTPWRRWPFLQRAGWRRLFDGTERHVTLSNPEVPLDVGTHVLKPALPTVQDDFFDLPVIKNFLPLLRFRKSAHTLVGRRPSGHITEDTQLSPIQEYMAYECMVDIWASVFVFRLARYVTHFGAALTIAGAVVTAVYVAGRAV